MSWMEYFVREFIFSVAAIFLFLVGFVIVMRLLGL
jgi:hypothetical protein